MIRTKSIKSLVDPAKDGLRILVTRFRGRGPKARYDVWMANLGPSEVLLKDFLSGRIGWREYRVRYDQELNEAGGVDRFNTTIKNHGQKFTLRLLRELGTRGPVTLLCHCAEENPHCHRHLLKKKLA